LFWQGQPGKVHRPPGSVAALDEFLANKSFGSGDARRDIFTDCGCEAGELSNKALRVGVGGGAGAGLRVPGRVVQAALL
jgi:hypothetical protein